jgi:ADP-heptose:LPS heptosyltransferase
MRLLIFKVNQLGDNIVFLPVVQWLEKLLPGTAITLLTSPVAAPLYGNCARSVHVIQEPTAGFNGAWKSPRELLRLRRVVRAVKPDACFVANDQGNVAHLLARLSGAKIRVGPRESRCRLRALLSHQVPLRLADPVALQNWRIAAALLDAVGADRGAMPDAPPAPDVSALIAPGSADKPFVLIHPGASRAYQRWFIERYVELANRLAAKIDVRFVSQNEAAEAALDPRVQRVGTGSLQAFFGIMSQAALFIGNNSGPMHIASVCGVPGVIFIGPSAHHWRPMWHAERFTLLRDPSLACQPCDADIAPVNHCTNTSEPMACMKRVSVDEAHRVVCGRLGLT